MAGIDKVAIAFSIAIVAIALGIVASLDATQSAGSVVSAPEVQTQTSEMMAAEKAAAAAVEAAEKAAAAAAAEAEKAAAAAAAEAKASAEKAAAAAEKVAAEAAATITGPQTFSVSIPIGTLVAGCEVTMSCYLPANITINAGDTVEWINEDTAPHTVTAGSKETGPTGVFDSSLIMASANYALTFNDAGSFDYYCMVHPWMTGSVTVN